MLSGRLHPRMHRVTHVSQHLASTQRDTKDRKIPRVLFFVCPFTVYLGDSTYVMFCYVAKRAGGAPCQDL